MQVVTLVLYTYFIAALLGRQMIPKVDGALPSGKYEDPDLYFPLFTALQVSIMIKYYFYLKIFTAQRLCQCRHPYKCFRIFRC